MESYWTTIATVIPVLVLAVVIEIRAYGPRWHEQPVWLRMIQGALWMAFFALSTVVELGAVEALRPDLAARTPGWLPEASTIAVASGLGVLFLNPAIEILFRMSIPFFAWIGSHKGLAVRAWWLHHRARSMESAFLRVKRSAADYESKYSTARESLVINIDNNGKGVAAARAALGSNDLEPVARGNITTYLEKAVVWEVDAKQRLSRIDEILSSKPADITEDLASLVTEAKKTYEETRALARTERLALQRQWDSIPLSLNPILPPAPPGDSGKNS